MRHWLLYMTSFVLMLSIAMALLSFSNDGKNLISCGGKDRWEIKTLTDKGSAFIDTNIVEVGDISQLCSFVVPTTPRSQRSTLEMMVYQVDCKVREYKSEADGDYHLVLMDIDDTTLTMIAEIPDPTCSRVKKSKFNKCYKKSRKAFESYIINSKKIQSGVYRIVGVCFFDKMHGQLGAAPNGIEIHPILKFQKL